MKFEEYLKERDQDEVLVYTAENGTKIYAMFTDPDKKLIGFLSSKGPGTDSSYSSDLPSKVASELGVKIEDKKSFMDAVNKAIPRGWKK